MALETGERLKYRPAVSPRPIWRGGHPDERSLSTSSGHVSLRSYNGFLGDDRWLFPSALEA